MRVVAVENTDQKQACDAIECALLASLASSSTQAENRSIVLVSRRDDGTLAGGLTGSTSYGWLLVKTLWVDELERGTGLGKQLMIDAEAKARQYGCHNAWLDTSSENARYFYLHLGYFDFGILENAGQQSPAGHRRWFMRKRLLCRQQMPGRN